MRSESLCCPAPNYCCPNSLSSCRDKGAVFFDAIKAGVPETAIAHAWPRTQGRPYTWEMTPASRKLVSDVFARTLAAPPRAVTQRSFNWAGQQRSGIAQLAEEPTDFRLALKKKKRAKRGGAG